MNKPIDYLTLGDCGVEIVSGQIMSRLTVREGSDDDVVAVLKVVVPKCIHGDGSIAVEEMPEERLHTAPDLKRMTEPGDIVMKLSTPYDAARVDEDSAACVVPSFCAIIKSSGELNPDYLLAFLNSSSCKKQIKTMVAGATMAMLSVGKVKSIRIPVPEVQIQHAIGGSFMETQDKVHILEKIISLEQKKNDIYFRDMVSSYEK